MSPGVFLEREGGGGGAGGAAEKGHRKEKDESNTHLLDRFRKISEAVCWEVLR